MFFRWRRSRNKRSAPARREASPAPTEAATGEQTTVPAYRVVASVQTDVGCHREVNEDQARYVRPSDPERLTHKGSLVVVADGMGGHVAGEVASRYAVDVINRVYYTHDAPPRDALEAAFHEANRVIHQEARQQAQLQGMGTTATALVLRGSEALLAHVGDSRLYLVRDGGLYRMSEDHSLVNEMVRQGLLRPDEARNHEDKNVILRALGTRPTVEVEVWPEPFRVRVGDRFLLCSDGLYDLVEDEEILEAIMAEEPHEACARLIALAKERGGYDNITVGVLRLVPLEEDEAEDDALERATREHPVLREEPPDAPPQPDQEAP